MAEIKGLLGFTDKQLHELIARRELMRLNPSSIFDLPVQPKLIKAVEVASPSHDKAKNLFGAVDFIAPEGTEVIMPCKAIVADVISGFGKGGNDEKYKDMANRFSLIIPWGFSMYTYIDLIHVKPNTQAMASKGKELEIGTSIGTIDESGWTTEPHVHMFAEDIVISPQTREVLEDMTSPLRLRFANKYLMSFHARFLYPR